jgi:hypothetical protein
MYTGMSALFVAGRMRMTKITVQQRFALSCASEPALSGSNKMMTFTGAKILDVV